MVKNKPVYGVVAIAVVMIIAALAYYMYPTMSSSTRNQPPVPKISIDKTRINTGEVVTFSAQGSFDKDGKITRYVWDFGDGVVEEGESVNHTYTSGGWYNVSLTVEDDMKETATHSMKVYVNYSPMAVISIENGDGEFHINDVIKLTGKESSDEDGSIVGYEWDFGDGGKGSGMEVSHKYKSLGTYTITLKVYDDSNATDTAKIGVSIVERSFKISWKVEDKVEFQQNGSTNEGESTTITANTTQANILKLEVKLEWVDDFPLPAPLGLRHNEKDELGIEAVSPEGLSKGNNSTSGSIVLTFDLASLPEDHVLKAGTMEDAVDYANALYGSEIGIGTWTITIKAIKCGDGLLISGGLFPDNGNSWSVSVSVTYYTPVLEEV